MRGTYVRGWKFDWDEAGQDFDKYMAAGREHKAASCADPGFCMCPNCGEHHWREYEVFLCCRCGAEVTIGKEVTAGEPKHPEKCRTKIHDGMRVKFIGSPMRGRKGESTTRPGLWPAGTIQPGTTGTIEREQNRPDGLIDWTVSFDGVIPKTGYCFGVFGQFLGDEFVLAD